MGRKRILIDYVLLNFGCLPRSSSKKFSRKNESENLCPSPGLHEDSKEKLKKRKLKDRFNGKDRVRGIPNQQ
jgi:hypothetical protein